MRLSFSLMLATSFLVACADDTQSVSAPVPSAVSLQANSQTGRWYSQAQVENGKALFGQYCAGCHGANAESTDQWRTPDVNGNYPPPPLNGSAHGWHHPLEVLDMVIRDGGKPLGGVMPAWGNILNGEQRLNVIASFQSYWPDKTYDMWLERELSSREN